MNTSKIKRKINERSGERLGGIFWEAAKHKMTFGHLLLTKTGVLKFTVPLQTNQRVVRKKVAML